MTITAHLLLEAQRDVLLREIDFRLESIAILEGDLAAEQEKLHRVMAEERTLEDALDKVPA